MQIITQLTDKNPCNRQNRYINPTGIVVHSTACNQKNPYVFYNTFNNYNCMKNVHAFIGIAPQDPTKVITLQTMPWKMRSWGCGQGNKGSWNDTRIQFEICEDNHTSKEYLRTVINEAVELCAYLCYTYNIQTSAIHCHCEGHAMGYASNHSDVNHWWLKFGYTMDMFRKEVKAKVTQMRYQKTLTVDDLKANVNRISTSETKPTPAPVQSVSNNKKPIVVGSIITIKQGAVDMNSGRRYSPFVYNTKYKVLSISQNGNRIVFGPKQGDIIGATRKEFIIVC